jgi:hypothetical protein
VDEYDTGYIEMIEQQNRDIEAAAEAAAKLDLNAQIEASGVEAPTAVKP